MKILISDWNNIFTDLKKRLGEFGLEETKNVADGERMLLWNDVMPDAIANVNLGRKLKMPIITVQHGRFGTSKYFQPFNQEILSDKLCVWGSDDKDKLVEAGHNPDKIVITGTTALRHLKARREHDGINIIFCPEHWDTEVEENRKTAKKLRKLKRKIRDVKITTKIIDVHNKEWYDNPIYSDRRSTGHLEICADILSTADLVVGIRESTFELMAQILDIPVVIMNEWEAKICGEDPGYLTYERVMSDASKKTSLEDLIKTIQHQLENPDELKEQRKKVAITQGGMNIKDPVKEIVQVIKNA